MPLKGTRKRKNKTPNVLDFFSRDDKKSKAAQKKSIQRHIAKKKFRNKRQRKSGIIPF